MLLSSSHFCGAGAALFQKSYLLVRLRSRSLLTPLGRFSRTDSTGAAKFQRGDKFMGAAPAPRVHGLGPCVLQPSSEEACLWRASSSMVLGDKSPVSLVGESVPPYSCRWEIGIGGYPVLPYQEQSPRGSRVRVRARPFLEQSCESGSTIIRFPPIKGMPLDGQIL